MSSPETFHNRRIVLSNFGDNADALPAFREEIVPVGDLQQGFVQLKTRYVTVDARLRAKASVLASPSLNVGDIIASDGLAEVTLSNHSDFSIGALVIGPTGWQSRPQMPGGSLQLVDLGDLDPTAALYALGTPALEAFSALGNIGRAKAGETLLIPAATSAFSSLMAQMAGDRGLWTVGIVSNQREAIFVQQRLGFHAAVDHTSADFEQILRRACPNGVDLYVETIGGALWSQVRPLMNLGGHVVLTGSWSQYEHPLSGRAEFASAATLEAVIRRKLTLGVAPPLQNRDMFTKQSLERLRQGQILSKALQ